MDLETIKKLKEMNDRIRARANRLNPFFGQQQQGNSYSIPTGGFLGQNQVGGQSRINVYRRPEPELTPEELEAQQLEERAAQYQQGVAEFNLGQKEAELGKRKAEAEEIASGRNILNGRAVTRAEMDQYLQGVKQSGAKAQANFNRENPFYAAAKASMPRAPQPDQFSNDQDYQRAISEYLSPANKQAREQEFTRKLNQSRSNALTNSINQFRNDPMGYLLGGGREGSSTYSPDDLMGYLGQANQLFKATGQEGNFMDFILGGSSTGQGGSQPRYNPSNLTNLLAGALSPQQSAEERSRELAAQYEAYRRDQSDIYQFERDLQKQKGSNDYIFRNLTEAERKSPDINSAARMRARRENKEEIERDMAAFRARYN